MLSGPGRPPGPGAPTASLPDSFVLAVGALEPRKLPHVLAEAHGRARAEGLGAELVFAGDGPLRAELEETGATVLGHVPDAVLDALYEGALAVACVSREEGFGFTPLEALARGLPRSWRTSPCSPRRSATRAASAPGRPRALADALLRLERDPALRERLIEAGREAVERLSWGRSARETRAVLEEAAGR